ncbi:cyanoexosortase B [Cronbergia sp. UHCC 0137]|uniref:cyanoexosortase B n=1 Tax=Cronbergia sp. UHCC 0137 TaxID=3110239 RepID=UPI002B20DB99|nr:cyanoexosortase B [Cronbergia sp. UHCC 0137]MEA5618098.1 cyanoexosortase B [Cronbergia sp. UHCC 0137]
MLVKSRITNKLPTELFNLSIISILLLLYAPLIWHWFDGWLHKNISTEHEYFSHGIIGLPYAAYLVWIYRKKWQRLPTINHPFSFFILLIGGIFYVSGVTDWVNLSLPIILAGLCLSFKGIPGLKMQIFPLLLVFLATPTALPYLIAPYTLPLQSFIAGTAGFIINQFGMAVTVEGINLYVGGRIVEVAPYCAGLKMLFTTLYVSLMLLYWTNTLSYRRLTLTFLSMSITISVTANIIRNTILTFFHGTNQDTAFAWLHDGWGGDLYSGCMLLLLVPLLNWLSNYIAIEPENHLKKESQDTLPNVQNSP